jgi:hypothetical protein
MENCKCEQCENSVPKIQLLNIIDPFSGKLVLTICEVCNERNYDNYIESFYG